MKKVFYFDEDYKEFDEQNTQEKEYNNLLRLRKYDKTRKFAERQLINKFGVGDYTSADHGEPPVAYERLN